MRVCKCLQRDVVSPTRADYLLRHRLIRMESWKGATSLSFCFNDGYFKPEDAARFLKDIAGFMLAFAQ